MAAVEAKKIAQILKEVMIQEEKENERKEMDKKMLQKKLNEDMMMEKRRKENEMATEAARRRQLDLNKQKRDDANRRKTLCEKNFNLKQVQMNLQQQEATKKIKDKQERETQKRLQKKNLRIQRMREADRERNQKWMKKQTEIKAKEKRLQETNEKKMEQMSKDTAEKMRAWEDRKERTIRMKEKEINQKAKRLHKSLEDSMQRRKLLREKEEQKLQQLALEAERKRNLVQVRKAKSDNEKLMKGESFVTQKGEVVEARVGKLEKDKEAQSRLIRTKIEDHQEASRSRRLMLERERKKENKQRRKKIKARQKKVQEFLKTRMDMADYARKEGVDVERKRQEMQEMMDKLSRTHGGLDRLQRAGINLENPNPDTINAENIIKILEGRSPTCTPKKSAGTSISNSKKFGFSTPTKKERNKLKRHESPISTPDSARIMSSEIIKSKKTSPIKEVPSCQVKIPSIVLEDPNTPKKPEAKPKPAVEAESAEKVESTEKQESEVLT